MQLDFLKEFEFFTGVPDSLLKPLCDYLLCTYGISPQHIVAANEGNCVALAAGYHLATGKVPVVYLQNSGEGNIINPVASLMNDQVYGMPCVFIVGWRGEPGVHDEPQHVYQGLVTLKLLDDMDIAAFVIDQSTTAEEVQTQLNAFRPLLSQGKQVAFVIKKGALEFNQKPAVRSAYPMTREEIIGHIAKAAGEDVIISTTGKASRELFEYRARHHEGHERDFLTVGSMGHASSIALGVALQKPCRRVWCIDGDGAALMHMGAMAVIGSNHPQNMIHIVINNEAHETVGGMPTVAGKIDLSGVASACGYPLTLRADDESTLLMALETAKSARQLCFIEARCGMGARADLGRPTTSAKDNKAHFMAYLAD